MFHYVTLLNLKRLYLLSQHNCGWGGRVCGQNYLCLLQTPGSGSPQPQSRPGTSRTLPCWWRWAAESKLKCRGTFMMLRRLGLNPLPEGLDSCLPRLTFILCFTPWEKRSFIKTFWSAFSRLVWSSSIMSSGDNLWLLSHLIFDYDFIMSSPDNHLSFIF